MKKLYLNTGGFDAVFNDLKDSFNGELIAENNEYNLEIKSKWTKGSIKGTRFDDKVLFMHFDLVFNQDVSLSIESFQSAPVFFVYCENGNITHSFGVNGEKRNLKKSQSAVLNNSSVINSVLFFESHKRIQFTILGMPTFAVENKNSELTSQVKKHFTNDSSGNFIYIGKENLKISEKLQEYKAVPQKGIVGTLLRKSILKDIFELEIAQHSYNYLKTFDPIVNLASRQLNEIKRISNINFSEVITAAGAASRNYLPRILKEKYHFSFKSYNQKLAS
ncbi:hypothetical protein IR010_02135 [Flavobacterium sp. MR2016-29]|uniref:hypothetical protein n=1 Tax=Flavobacterium sp. MR2016-29 TaxID=2783795 RepID=UPI00188BFA27|nr:hypothetical protein [Flavobacterium sp. MR2016-29]MBF4491322.1 hypothetical protein [Flavobacterium sp. MR2016-29]